MRTYVEFEISEGAYELSCPDALCSSQGVVSLAEISQLASASLVAKHHRYRLNRGVNIHFIENICLHLSLQKSSWTRIAYGVRTEIVKLFAPFQLAINCHLQRHLNRQCNNLHHHLLPTCYFLVLSYVHHAVWSFARVAKRL